VHSCNNHQSHFLLLGCTCSCASWSFVSSSSSSSSSVQNFQQKRHLSSAGEQAQASPAAHDASRGAAGTSNSSSATSNDSSTAQDAGSSALSVNDTAGPEGGGPQSVSPELLTTWVSWSRGRPGSLWLGFKPDWFQQSCYLCPAYSRAAAQQYAVKILGAVSAAI
jgi:cobalamin biosynthesis Mg chelatase CobN